MNILQISVSDYGGCAYALAEAIGETTEHSALSVRTGPDSYLKYPTHHAAIHPDDLRGLWEWANVVHVHDVMPRLPPDFPLKPTVVTYHGSMYRRGPTVYNNLIKRWGWIGTVATLDLTAHGLAWMPDCRPSLEAFVDRPEGRFIVSHAPTSRVQKDTESVIRKLGKREGIVLDIIERVDNETCLTRKGRSSVYVDQFKLCYGLNTIEAWTMGIPSIANALPENLTIIESVMGSVPFVQSTIDDLAKTVLRLRDDEEFYTQAINRGRECWTRYHSPEAAATQAVSFYTQALAAGVPKRMPTSGPTYKSRGEIALETGEGGLVKLRYTGGNVGSFTVRGPVTQTAYRFSAQSEADRTKFVDARDAKTMVLPTRGGRGRGGRRGKIQFEVVG